MLFANNELACAPPTVQGTKAEVRRGFAIASNQHALCELKVIFNSKYQDSVLHPESSVFVLLEQATGDSWAKRIFTHEGKQFVLVPAHAVRAYTERIPVGEETITLAG